MSWRRPGSRDMGSGFLRASSSSFLLVFNVLVTFMRLQAAPQQGCYQVMHSNADKMPQVLLHAQVPLHVPELLDLPPAFPRYNM